MAKQVFVPKFPADHIIEDCPFCGESWDINDGSSEMFENGYCRLDCPVCYESYWVKYIIE